MKKYISSILLVLAFINLYGSILLWAPVCDNHMMPCNDTAKVELVLGIFALVFAIESAIFTKNKTFLSIIALGLTMIILTYLNKAGFGICSMEHMHCHTTVWWIYLSGILTIVAGVFRIPMRERK